MDDTLSSIYLVKQIGKSIIGILKIKNNKGSNTMITTVNSKPVNDEPVHTHNFEYVASITGLDGHERIYSHGVDLHIVLVGVRKYVKFPTNGNRVRTYLIQYNSYSTRVQCRYSDDVAHLTITVRRW